MSLTFTILGCGSSGGVPRIGGDWGQCDPANPKNRRRRCSALVTRSTSHGATRVLIDTSPDMREQMLDAAVPALDAVVFTHEHADHTHGIDELRAYYLRQRKRVPVWADQPTVRILKQRFAYIFETPPGSQYPPVAELHPIGEDEIVIEGAGGSIALLPFAVHHGDIDALGFRIKGLAYTPDLNGIPEAAREPLTGLDTWVVDALRRTPHPSHFSLGETLGAIAAFKPKSAVITNMHLDLDFETLARELPKGCSPAYDGRLIPIE
jgi:phosphoribosyl 1,2-cyclic phosphate phosphodiesterase